MSFIICRQWVKLGKEFFHCMSVHSIQWDENIIHLLSLRTIQSTNHLPEKELEDLIDGVLDHEIWKLTSHLMWSGPRAYL